MQSNKRAQSSKVISVARARTAPITTQNNDTNVDIDKADSIQPFQHLADSAVALLMNLPDTSQADCDAESSNTRKVLQPKRPVGRPRLHPKKILDPNRIKRGESHNVLLFWTFFLTLRLSLLLSSAKGKHASGQTAHGTFEASDRYIIYYLLYVQRLDCTMEL